MKKVEISCHLTEYEPNELEGQDKVLISDARKIMESAYAPYSHFKVGAVVLLENGVIVKGNNQENAAYPTGLCAERVAIFAAGANYPGVPIRVIAITAKSDDMNVGKPVAPCGACRQAIAEYEHLHKKEIRILMAGETGKVMVADSIGCLLPFQFNSDDLMKK